MCQLVFCFVCSTTTMEVAKKPAVFKDQWKQFIHYENKLPKSFVCYVVEVNPSKKTVRYGAAIFSNKGLPDEMRRFGGKSMRKSLRQTAINRLRFGPVCLRLSCKAGNLSQEAIAHTVRRAMLSRGVVDKSKMQESRRKRKARQQLVKQANKQIAAERKTDRRNAVTRRAAVYELP